MPNRTGPTSLPPTDRKESLSVQGIPQEFYGGANPVIHFKTTTKEVDVNALSTIPIADQKAYAEQSAAGANNPRHPVHFFSSPKKIALASVILLGVVMVGAGGYFYWQTVSRGKLTKGGSTRPPSTTVVADFLAPTTTPTPSLPVPITPVTSPIARLEVPSLLLTDSADDDRDVLTNQEETLYRSDVGVGDSDADSYPDGHEIYFLYSPIEKEPSRLLNSGAVTDYANSSFGYQLYYPTAWKVDSVDADNRDVLFSSLGGEYIEVRVFDRPFGTTFADWLATAVPSEKLTDLGTFATRANGTALARQDYLVYYFVTSDRIIAMVYHAAANQTEISFRSTLTMMARSFRTSQSLETVSLPGGARVLGEPTRSFFAEPSAPVVPEPASTTVSTTDTGLLPTTSSTELVSTTTPVTFPTATPTTTEDVSTTTVSSSEIQ